MKASKNAHDWHCEDHDTYGWRGEACPLCPKARGEAEMIEQLEAENKRLRSHIAQLREAVEEGLRTYKVPMTARICEALTATEPK